MLTMELCTFELDIQQDIISDNSKCLAQWIIKLECSVSYLMYHTCVIEVNNSIKVYKEDDTIVSRFFLNNVYYIFVCNLTIKYCF